MRAVTTTLGLVPLYVAFHGRPPVEGWTYERALVVAGSEDHFPTVAMSWRVAETIPGARLHVVAGGGHFPNRTHRAEVQAVIARWLDELEG